MLFQDNPQASSTPSAVRPENIAASTHKSVQIPGVEININLNHLKKTSPNSEMTDVVLPVLPAVLSTPDRRSVAHLTPPRQHTPRHITPSLLKTPGRTPSIKDKFLAELDARCNAAKAVKETQAAVIADPPVLNAPLCIPTHRVQKSLEFGSPKPTTVQQANLQDISTQPQVSAPSNATITLNVVVDHQQHKSPSVLTERTVSLYSIRNL